jgi:hypothetical protein
MARFAEYCRFKKDEFDVEVIFGDEKVTSRI